MRVKGTNDVRETFRKSRPRQNPTYQLDAGQISPQRTVVSLRQERLEFGCSLSAALWISEPVGFAHRASLFLAIVHKQLRGTVFPKFETIQIEVWRAWQLRRLGKGHVGTRASRMDVASSEKGSEGRSYRDVRGFWDTVEEEADTKPKQENFNWLEQWYPISVLKHMDKKQPYAETILGRDLAVWWDRNAGRWQVFDDACPHRLAPLSEGRIHESGHLQCSYHGWTFNSCGSCTLIPQIDQGREQAQNNKRACVKVYVSKEHQGILWVWMDTAEGAEQRAAANPPPTIPMLDDPSFVVDIGMSHLNYGWEMLVENLVDPSHVPFAHHGLQGNRNAARPINFKLVDSHIQGFEAHRDQRNRLEFHAPTLSRMDFFLPPPKTPKGHPLALKLREWIMSSKKTKEAEEVKAQVSVIAMCVPVTPGKSKLLFAFPRNFGKIAHWLTPRWFGHLTHMTVIDSDLMFLHKLEHKLAELGGNTEKVYYTPALADTCVIEFRKWFRKYANSQVDFGPKSSATLPPTPARREFFDRQASHVARCMICQGAAANFKKLETVLQVLPFAAVGLVATAALNSWRSISRFSVPLVCLAVASAVASKLLSQFITKHYEYHDYNHALVD
ncbi:hypothetical protein R1flu_001026 [Riccia fluitans]|uniref:Rieske domain-containing protein n=1 Tax=Riccia fluitans TaxID=41844 RepID=A0ABD1Y2G6_9MARC